MVVGIITVSLLVLVLSCWHWSKKRIRHQQPMPGPRGWPLIGNAGQIDGTRPYVTTAEWAREYGDIYQISLGGQRVVVITGEEVFQEMFIEKGADFANRLKSFRTDLCSFSGRNIMFHDYNRTFRTSRKLLLQGLKQHDLKHIEDITLKIVEELVRDFQGMNGVAFDPSAMVRDALIQVLYVLVFSEYIEKDDVEMELLKTFEWKIVKVLSFIGEGAVLDMLPWLRHFGNSTFKEIMEVRELSVQLYTTWKAKSLQGDPCWFSKMISQLNDIDDFDEINLMMVTIDIFSGGISTSGSVMATFLNLMVHYPSVQERIYAEIMEHVGAARRVVLADRGNMPYTRAAILETLRYNTTAPFNAHVAAKDSYLRGHLIQKGTLVLVNLWGHHHDPAVWEAPFEFRPERFLTEEGRLVPVGQSPRKDAMQFGGGPRKCPGEVLALTRLFLFITNIIQRFRISPASDLDLQTPIHPQKDFVLGVVLNPKPYQIRLEDRSKTE